MKEDAGEAGENELKPIVKKQKIFVTDGKTNKVLPSNGPVASSLHTLLQWEARLPSLQETEKKLTLADVWNKADSKETVEFQTDDKVCIGLYVPTGSTIDGYRLLKNGTILEVTVLTHKLMWEPNGIQLSLQESTSIQDGYDSHRMKARKRFMSEAIKTNIMKEGHVPSEHKFEVALKKQVSTNANDTIHFCHTFECSSQNKEQLFFAYFEMTILKPKLSFLSPKKIGSQVNRMDTSNAGNSSDHVSSSSSRNSDSSSRNNNNKNSSAGGSNASFPQTSYGQNSLSNNPVNPDAIRFEAENNDLKKKVASFKQERKSLLRNVEKETNTWKKQEQERFKHREFQITHAMNMQLKENEKK